MKKLCLLAGLLYCISSSAFAQITGSIRIEEPEVEVSESGYEPYVSLSFPGSQPMTEVGCPQLPYVTRSYVIPVDARVTGVQVVRLSKQLFPGYYRIVPAQQPVPTNNVEMSPDFQLNDSLYASSGEYPGERVRILYDGYDQGYHIVTVGIYPVEYRPASREVYLCDIDYMLEYSVAAARNGSATVLPKQSRQRADRVRDYIRSYVQNPGQVSGFAPAVEVREPVDGVTVHRERNRAVAPMSLSVMEEVVPDYLIITNETLKPAFQKLADWKTAKGVPAIIKTTEEIMSEYPGSDMPERIRNYLIACYRKWGAGLYVLLGGDYNIIPAKKFPSRESPDTQIVVDLYYATTDGGWNISSSTDPIQYSVNSFQGRASVENFQEAETFVKKVLVYEKTENINVSYYNNILIYNGFNYQDNLGTLSYQGKYSLTTRITYPDYIYKWFIFDDNTCSGASRYKYNSISMAWNEGPCIMGDQELNKKNVLSALNGGVSQLLNPDSKMFHIVYCKDHGSPASLGTSSKDKGESLTREDVSGLQNENYLQIFMTGSCNTADFQKDCIAERFLNNPDGGAVAYIGNSDIGWNSEFYQFNSFINAWKNSGVSHSLGYLFRQMQTLNESGQYFGSNRKMVLLGDPEMPVWSKTPETLDVSVASVDLDGLSTFNFTIGQMPDCGKMRICLKKGDEAYLSQEITEAGIFSCSLPLRSRDSVDVVITAPDCIPYIERLGCVADPEVNLYVSDIVIDDGAGVGTIGNSDGNLDAGETVAMSVLGSSNGRSTAHSVTARIFCDSPYITLLDSTITIGDIPSGISKESQNKFRFRLDKDMPELLKNNVPDSVLRFTVVMYAEGINIPFPTSFALNVYTANLAQGNKEIISGNNNWQAGSEVSFNVDLTNRGRGDATGLTAVLSAVGSSFTVLSGQSAYADIKQWETKPNTTSFTIRLADNYAGEALVFNLKVTNAYGRQWNYIFNLKNRPSVVRDATIKARPEEAEVLLSWGTVSSAYGYNIYRATGPSSDYQKINRFPVTLTNYRDYGLASLTDYMYKISAVSVDGNESPLSSPVSVSTIYPQMGLFPVLVKDAGRCISVRTADVDFSGKHRILTTHQAFEYATQEGFIEVLNTDGTEMFDIDNNVTTRTGFAKLKSHAQGLAVGDLFGTGEKQLVATTLDVYRAENRNQVVCYAFTDSVEHNKPDLLWSRDVGNFAYMKAPIIANLDNSPDCTQEIVLITHGNSPVGYREIQIWNCHGEKIRTLESGLSIYSWLAVADLDFDGDMEIIAGLPGKVKIWHHDGTSYLGRETFYSESVTVNGEVKWYDFKSPVVVDLDKDGRKEIVIPGTTGGNIFRIFVLRADGTLQPGWENTETIYNNNPSVGIDVAVGDLYNNGDLSVVALGQNCVKIWNDDGTILRNIPVPGLEPGVFAPILADMDGNEAIDIIFGNTASSDNAIYVYSPDGTRVKGFPVYLEENGTMQTSPVVEDVDDDDKNELIAAYGGNIYMWKTNGWSFKIEWGSYRGDSRNTGEYHTPTPYIIEGPMYWFFSMPVGGDFIIKEGGTLEVPYSLIMSKSSNIIVKSGGHLIVEGTIQNANIKVFPGGKLTMAGGSIRLRQRGECTLLNGAELDFQSGEIKHE